MIESVYWIFPFVITLFFVALGPLLFAHHWETYSNRWLGVCAMGAIGPFLYYFGLSETLHYLSHVLINEYIPFIGLAFALFVVASGIYIDLPGKSSVLTNMGILLVASFFASMVGTLGASLIFIRPFLKHNAWRFHKTHLAIFFIFMVSNIGGVLTPLGDPPLFLGFLQGVRFFWTFHHLFWPFLTTLGVLLAAFYAIDRYYYQKENFAGLVLPHPFSFQGKKNLLFLIMIIVVIFITSEMEGKNVVTIASVDLKNNAFLRDLLVIGIAMIAWKNTPKEILIQNRFSWAPLKETALLFAVIFITLIPVNLILQEGEAGVMAALFKMKGIKNDQNPLTYFWICGLLSGVLDNAPTYMIFFKIAGGSAEILMTKLAAILKAISLGAVFMGALTYIGNAPNLMVKGIAQEYGVTMPTFLGYIRYSLFLLPLFGGVSWYFLS
jgi:Na+/H+ antiporter NhaD/arsenite permease-like protein